MLRGLFKDKASIDSYRQVEGVLTNVSGPHTHSDWPFYFCTLRLDNGENIRLSISDEKNVVYGQRVRGRINPICIFTGHEHINTLERVGPPSVLRRLQTAITRKFGR